MTYHEIALWWLTWIVAPASMIQILIAAVKGMTN